MEGLLGHPRLSVVTQNAELTCMCVSIDMSRSSQFMLHFRLVHATFPSDSWILRSVRNRLLRPTYQVPTTPMESWWGKLILTFLANFDDDVKVEPVKHPD